MNNEPVAWRSKDTDGYWSIYQAPVEGAEPLYTHPADITDEEIYKIANSIETIQPQHGLRLSNDLNVMDFARAILRKAQEK